MTIFEDMCSTPERMAEYLACWLTCANCPGQAMCDREEFKHGRNKINRSIGLSNTYNGNVNLPLLRPRK